MPDASDGEYTMFIEPEAGTIEGEDGYDTVEWIAEQPWCNGRVGTMGASYDGWQQWQTAAQRPPHLVCMCACSIPPEMQEVDWPFGGGFKPARRVKWLLTTIAPDLRRREGLPPPHTPAEAADWWELEGARLVEALPLAPALERSLPTALKQVVTDWLMAKGEPRPWRLADHWPQVSVPNLDVTGWFDHCNGTLAHLGGLQTHGATAAAREHSRCVIGPW